MWTAAFVAGFKVLLCHLPGGIEGNHEKSQPRWPAFQPKFEPGISGLPVMNITSSGSLRFTTVYFVLGCI
jgi:hypothetical protein